MKEKNTAEGKRKDLEEVLLRLNSEQELIGKKFEQFKQIIYQVEEQKKGLSVECETLRASLQSLQETMAKEKDAMNVRWGGGHHTSSLNHVSSGEVDLEVAGER